MDFLSIAFQSQAFLNAFWLFLGVVAGAFIQHVLALFSKRSQAKTALQVMQIEIEYNQSEVLSFLRHIQWLRQRISAGQIEESDLFLPMQKFDYSSIGPLSNSGYFHVFLGAANFRRYLEFNHFFRVENGQDLTSMLRTEHAIGQSLAFLENIEKRAVEVSSGLSPIRSAKLHMLYLKLVVKHEA